MRKYRYNGRWIRPTAEICHDFAPYSDGGERMLYTNIAGYGFRAVRQSDLCLLSCI